MLDLTRVRSGPTCVRQLADWGANVIKIDSLVEGAGGEQAGGPRHGSDFQNLHGVVQIGGEALRRLGWRLAPSRHIVVGLTGG